jgi:uncharacterized protein YqeY
MLLLLLLPQAAMKAKDADRLNAIRFLSAAIKQREIELRESGKEVTPQAQLLWALFVCIT